MRGWGDAAREAARWRLTLTQPTPELPEDRARPPCHPSTPTVALRGPGVRREVRREGVLCGPPASEGHSSCSHSQAPLGPAPPASRPLLAPALQRCPRGESASPSAVLTFATDPALPRASLPEVTFCLVSPQVSSRSPRTSAPTTAGRWARMSAPMPTRSWSSGPWSSPCWPPAWGASRS